MVLDYVRTCYKSSWRMWKEDGTLVRGRWFRAAPDAKVYRGVHAFASSVWRDPHENYEGMVGEIYHRYLDYDKGANPLNYPGDHICGSEAALREGGVHGRDKPLTTRVNGSVDCCFPVPPPPPAIPATFRPGFTPMVLDWFGGGGLYLQDPPIGCRMLVVVLWNNFSQPDRHPAADGYDVVDEGESGFLSYRLLSRRSEGAEPYQLTINDFPYAYMTAFLTEYIGASRIVAGVPSSGSGTEVSAAVPPFAGSVKALFLMYFVSGGGFGFTTGFVGDYPPPFGNVFGAPQLQAAATTIAEGTTSLSATLSMAADWACQIVLLYDEA